MRAIVIVCWLALTGLLAAGCGESGIGAPCIPGPQGVGNMRVVIGSGECTTAVCVAYLGSGGYCSTECSGDAACPAQYRCCPVTQTGGGNSCQDDTGCTPSQTCSQNVCRPRQFCVQTTEACQ